MGRAHSIVKAKAEVIGVEVKNHHEEKLGTIEDLVLDKFTGQVEYLILAEGGILGLGSKYLPIPWKALKYNVSKGCFLLNMDREKLKSAPSLDIDNLPDVSDAALATKLNTYYGVKSFSGESLHR